MIDRIPPSFPEAVIRHTNLYWQHTSAPGRIAAAIATDDIEFPS
ncbi:hypothetical protein [Nocardia terpenica]|nr:hypothetical protein [Nocardia terpenica]